MTIEFNRQKYIYSIQSRFLDQSSFFMLLCLFFFTILMIQHSSGMNFGGTADGRTQLVGAGMTPDGLSSAEWESIQAQIAAQSYQVTAAPNGGFVADNSANHWQTNFAVDGTTQLSSMQIAGTTWEWGLKLAGYGYGNGQAVGRPIALVNDGQTLTYQWDENLSEWWINSSEGLEQGFTLLERPQLSTSTSSLVIEMDVVGNLVPVVAGDTIQLQREGGETVITYDKLHVFDANGRTIPASFSVLSQGDGSYKLLITVDEADAVYPLTIDPTVQQAYVKASNTGAGDAFGRAVAVSGNTVVVAAYLEDSNSTGVNGTQGGGANDSGAAYVFVRSGGTWSQQAYLKASNTDANDWLGWTVAISGDIIVVGAPFEDGSATGVNGTDDDLAAESGAAYIYSRSGGNWTLDAYLKASNTEALDGFGISVAVSGETVVVGAWLEDSNATGVNGNEANNTATNSGAAYVFTLDAGTWSQQAYLKPSNTGNDDNFGASVAVSNDTIVVGANGEDSDSTGVNGSDNDLASNSGAAYIFTRSGSTWSQQAYLKASNTEADDSFGGYVGISGDTVAIAAGGEDSNATGVNGNEADNSTSAAGAAYVFTRSGGTWSQQAYLKASNTEPSGTGDPGDDQFGNSLSVDGDTIIVGAFAEDGSAIGINGTDNNSANNAGAAYLYTRSGSAWSLDAYIKASNTGISDLFGVSVGVSGDTILIGARNEDSNAIGINGSQGSGANNSGAAYIFREGFCSNQSGNWNSTSTWVGGVVPGSSDAACISIGDTVTLSGATAVDSLLVYPDAALDLSTFGFTAETSVTNHGTLSQTVTVNNNVVNFVEIRNAAATTVQYRGVTIDATDNAQNLGSVEVGVRETVNWYTALDADGNNYILYCTSREGNSPTYAQRCFRITPSIQPSSPVSVRLWGLTNELNGIAEGNLAVYRHVGGAGSTTWVELITNASNGNDGGSYSYAEGDTPGFSSFLLGEAGSAPTAVTLAGSSISPSNPFLILFAVLILSGLTYFTLQKRKKISV